MSITGLPLLLRCVRCFSFNCCLIFSECLKAGGVVTFGFFALYQKIIKINFVLNQNFFTFGTLSN